MNVLTLLVYVPKSSSDPETIICPDSTRAMCDCRFNTALPGSGERVEQVISAHPRLTAEGIRAAMAFAAEALRADVVYPMETIAG